MPASSSKDYGKDIDNLYAELDNIREELDSVLVEVNDMLAEWEDKQQVTQTTQEAATNVKWSWDITSSYPDNVVVDYWQTPSRMDSEGDYTIRITLVNNKTVAITDLILDVTYTPNGKPYVDNKNTFLDTTSSPYILWDTDIVTRGNDEYCRRISNMSEKINLKAGETLQLKLEFVLTYK